MKLCAVCRGLLIGSAFLPAVLTVFPITPIPLDYVETLNYIGMGVTLSLCLFAGIITKQSVNFLLGGLFYVFLVPGIYYGLQLSSNDYGMWVLFEFIFYFSTSILVIGIIAFAAGRFCRSGVLTKRWVYFASGGILFVFALPGIYFGMQLSPGEWSKGGILRLILSSSILISLMGATVFGAGRFLLEGIKSGHWLIIGLRGVLFVFVLGLLVVMLQYRSEWINGKEFGDTILFTFFLVVMGATAFSAGSYFLRMHSHSTCCNWVITDPTPQANHSQGRDKHAGHNENGT